MAVTHYQANKILDNLFGGNPIGSTGTLYIGLSKSSLNPNGTGYTEPSGNGYARVAVTNSKSFFSSASEGVLSNTQNITFNESTDSWGTITHVFIADAASSGNVLYYDVLNTPRTVEALTTLLFTAGTLQISLT